MILLGMGSALVLFFPLQSALPFGRFQVLLLTGDAWAVCCC